MSDRISIVTCFSALATLRAVVPAVAAAVLVATAHGETVIDMPPPPKGASTTYQEFQAGEGGGAAEEPDLQQADGREAGRMALDAYAYGRRAPRVLRPYSGGGVPWIASTFPGPSLITVNWGWRGLGFGWPGWGWAVRDMHPSLWLALPT